MKIVVAVKRVIDYNVKIRVKSDGSGVDTGNVKMAMNPFDEIAVEEAIRLKEKGKASEVVAVTIGPAKATDILHNALAMGADRGLLVETDDKIEPLAAAKILMSIVIEEQAGLVLVGKQAIDDDCNQTGQMLAGLLGWPQGTFASRLVVGEKTAGVSREIDGGSQVVALKMPCVITTDLGLNEPRYLSVPKIIAARKKPIETRSLANFPVDLTPRVKTISVGEPAPRQPGEILRSPIELAVRLKNDLGAL